MTEHGPDFVCVGMEKAGTGWLHDQLSNAAGAWMTPIKELNYFHGDPFTAFNLRRLAELSRRPELPARDRAFVAAFEDGRRRGKDAAWYRALFAIKGGLVSGDVSPNYAMADAGEIGRAVRECPGARYVLLLRHPVRRLWSALCMRVRKGQATQAELADASRVAALAAQAEHAERSYPTRIWAKWSAAVPPGEIRHWFLEDIADEPVRVRDEILAYVGLPGAAVTIAPDYNRKSDAWKLPMPPGVESRLTTLFADEIEACAERFGGRALDWRAALGGGR
jgi:Sulfotransferase family